VLMIDLPAFLGGQSQTRVSTDDIFHGNRPDRSLSRGIIHDAAFRLHSLYTNNER